ncbi:MAG: DUF3857 domain-containing protein, partial [Proteobacteria bacterium]|nr:DUF3857 domain-containing protein [Pseudomonadota bacterium]
MRFAAAALLACGCIAAVASRAADAPAWMHALSALPPPAHDEKTPAVLMYAEDVWVVRPDGRIRSVTRRAYRILRREGEHYGLVTAVYGSDDRVVDIRGWCIPASGKDYVVRERDTAETSLPGVANGELVSDVRAKLMRIPASVPGSLVGYEVEQEVPAYRFNAEWDPQDTIPVREARFTLELPPGWTYRTAWINHEPVIAPDPPAGGPRRWQWALDDLPAIRVEDFMPPWRGIAARMVVSVLSPDGKASGWSSWADLGSWFYSLMRDRRNATPELTERVRALTAAESTPIGKIRALSRFVQND